MSIKTASLGNAVPRSELAPFRLLEGEAPARPRQPRRLAFDDFGAGTRHLVGPVRSVVPVELAQPGDEQVVLSGCWADEHPSPLSLDPYLEATSIVSVIADRPFVVDKPQPRVRELFITCSWAPDSESLLCLPGLACLVLAGGAAAGYPLDLGGLRSLGALRDLMIDGWTLPSIDPFRQMSGLERLLLRGYIVDRRLVALESLANLRWLALHGPCTGWHRLGALQNLDRVELMGVRLANLRAFRRWSRLQSLKLGGSLGSFEGIEALRELEELACYGRRLPDLGPLAAIPNLRRLDLRTSEGWTDLTPLADLQTLHALDLTLGTVMLDGHLPSLDFLAGMPHLKEFWGRNARVEDGRLDALFGLPALKRAFVVGDLEGQAQELRRLRPGLDLQVVSSSGSSDQVSHRLGGIEIREDRAEGQWSIRQDLTALVGGDSNFEVSQTILCAIRERDPSLIRRLEFDPDADFVLMTARSEADILRAAEIILSTTGGHA